MTEPQVRYSMSTEQPVRALITFLDFELPYWGDMPGQEQRHAIYMNLLGEARRQVAAIEAEAAQGGAPLDVERVSRVLFDVFPQDDDTNNLIFEALARLSALSDEGQRQRVIVGEHPR